MSLTLTTCRALRLRLSPGTRCPSVICNQPQRPFFGWLNMIFNKVDPSRVAEVGPDRACAEWLLRCGASVRWSGKDTFIKDYNSLPVGGGRGLKILEVDATDAAIMEVGFPHFENLTDFRKLKLKNCL